MRYMLLIATLLLAGCESNLPILSAATRPMARNYKEVPKIKLPDPTLELSFEPVEFYMGDGLGKNLTLILLKGNHYTLTWNGCGGRYGTAMGAWRAEAGQLLLIPDEEEGWLAKYPIRKLDVLFYDDFPGPPTRVATPIFVPIEDKKAFLESGPNRFSCFRPIEMLGMP